MGAEDTRTSDRVYLELPIILRGTDASGRRFEEETRTLVISRRGAKIVSRQALVPQQILNIRCLKTGLEADARVVGPIKGEEEGCYYGIGLVHPEVNLWGINFPELTGNEDPAGRVFLECTRCRSQEVAHLDAFELEVLLANEALLRPCSLCTSSTLWMPPGPEAPNSQAPHAPRRLVEGRKEQRVSLEVDAARRRRVIEAPPPPRVSVQKRRQPRVMLEVDACVRHPVFGDETVVTENVSRGGFRFRSRKDYTVATLIEAALPYVPGAANIFTPARVVYKGEPSPDGVIAYGVAYIPTQMADSLTGMRISRPT